MGQWFLDVVVGWAWTNIHAVLLDLLLTGLLAYPLLLYITYGWARKAEEIESSTTVFAKQTYLSLFQQRQVPLSEVDARFAALYRGWYGRRRLIVPIAIVILVAAVGNFLVATDLIRLAFSSDGKLQVAPAAVAGAYTFVTFDFFARVQRRNLSVADIMRGGLRLAIAIPMGYAFAALLQPDLGAFIAFAVGVFPMSALITVLRQVANKRLGLEIGPAEVGSQVGQLSGVDPSTAERIEDADITTIPQLAWCDPIQLTMRTNLNFSFVVDICSQALAWVYLERKLDALRPLGLRGAYEIRVLVIDDMPDPAQAEKAQAVLAAAATAASVPVAGLTYAFEQIARDPKTAFLYDASVGLPTAGDAQPAPAQATPPALPPAVA